MIGCVRRLISLILLALALAAGCGGDGSGDGSGERLLVFAAASLSETFPQVDAAPLFNFAGSDDLALQIREGAPADVYAAASPRYPQELFAEGLVDEPRVFATNRLVVIVPAENEAGIESVEDLREPGVKLVIGAEGVPVGDYARTVLENLELTDAFANVVSEEDDVKGVAGKVALGEADAGFVYATDVKPVADDVSVIEIPAEAQPVIEYQIAIVSATEHREEAEAFIARVLGDEGRTALEEAGFRLP
jgi:molybdate transport system substrate-binding protein